MLIQQVLSSVHPVDIIAPCQKMFTVHRTLFHHAAWLDQASAHCPIFLTAASRRSLDRVSVPVWGTAASRRSLDRVSVPVWGSNLSVPLDIVALVGRYPTSLLMSREPISYRIAPFLPKGCPLSIYGVLVSVSRGYPPV